MDILLYNISIQLYKLVILTASLFNKKARLWLQGRKNIFTQLQLAIGKNDNVIWMHCASLGEFEQGRPVLEQLQNHYPNHKLLLTFFSPSGFEVRKNYNGAHWVFYLPLDTKSNAQKFISITKPKLVIFVKYEYWYHYLNELHLKNIPTVLISAIFRKNAPFFKWYGSVHRKMLHYFWHLFVQNKESYELVKSIIKSEKISIAGDTRFDRVTTIANSFTPLQLIEQFIENKKIIVAGSTWPDDELMLKKLLQNQAALSLIIAPHEITATHLNFLRQEFDQSVFYSQLVNANSGKSAARVLIIDNIGMLSKLYYYSFISYVGGGFNKSGIHNTLEAAVYGKPVVFGPNFQKFAEAVSLIKNKGGCFYNNENELIKIVDSFLFNDSQLSNYSNNAQQLVTSNTGATNTIIDWIKKISF